MRNLIVKSMIEGTKDTIKTIRRKKNLHVQRFAAPSYVFLPREKSMSFHFEVTVLQPFSLS